MEKPHWKGLFGRPKGALVDNIEVALGNSSVFNSRPPPPFKARSETAKNDYFHSHVCPPACLSVRMQNWAHTERIFMKFDIYVFFENLSRTFKFHQSMLRITGTLHKDQYTFLIISRSVFQMRNVSDKGCRENQNTHFMLNNLFFSFENRAFMR